MYKKRDHKVIEMYQHTDKELNCVNVLPYDTSQKTLLDEVTDLTHDLEYSGEIVDRHYQGLMDSKMELKRINEDLPKLAENARSAIDHLKFTESLKNPVIEPNE